MTKRFTFIGAVLLVLLLTSNAFALNQDDAKAYSNRVNGFLEKSFGEGTAGHFYAFANGVSIFTMSKKLTKECRDVQDPKELEGFTGMLLQFYEGWKQVGGEILILMDFYGETVLVIPTE